MNWRNYRKMTESEGPEKRSKADYRQMINQMGKKEFTLMKMQEYGFWPKDLPTPYERQESETEEDYKARKELMRKYKDTIDKISELYKTKDDINRKLYKLKREYNETWDYEKIRKDVAQKIMQESIARRKEIKRQREIEKQKRREAWKKKKAREIVHVGKGYSSFLYHCEIDKTKLEKFTLPLIESEDDLTNLLEIDKKELRFITYHRDVVEIDHYFRYQIPKRSGGKRDIAAPKPILKAAQRMILERILDKVPASELAHGFLKQKSIISGAKSHPQQPELVINMDMEDFFPTITFERVRGMFHALGYSGKISTLLAMICTYCERYPLDIKGRTKYVATSKRILPQGSPASPMITNIICYRLDHRLKGLSKTFGFNYSRYADDISFSLMKEENVNIGRFCGMVSIIINEEGFKINKNKTRYLRKNNRQEITGIVINNKELAIPRKWIRKYRATIHNCKRDYGGEKLPKEEFQKLLGMTAWVKSVNSFRYEKYIKSAMELLNK